MTEAIIFSKDRAAQLDLLLRSIKQRAPLLHPSYVIFHTTSSAYADGYQICEQEHPGTLFVDEIFFEDDVRECLYSLGSDTACFLTDDDLVVRAWSDYPSPEMILGSLPDLLCVSLRLGNNTKLCYPHNRVQTHPGWQMALTDLRLWEWAGKDGDWGYPGSLDGHVFRRNELLDLLVNQPWSSEYRGYNNPNQMEEVLNQLCPQLNHPLMGCYDHSLITGVPVNRVNTTHPNRAGDTHPMEPELLNAVYLGGKRLQLPDTSPAIVTAAHTELPLVFA